MNRTYVDQHQKNVEFDFTAKKLVNEESYLTLAEIKQELKTRKTNKRYPRIARFNQFRVLNKFIEKLNDKFGDKLLIQDRRLVNLEMVARDEDIATDRPTDITFCTDDMWCFLNFSIDDYFYYIQFGDNPFFENSSYITTKRIYKFDDTIQYPNHYFFREYYGGGKNINEFIQDIYSIDCDVEKGATELFNYFMAEKYQQENCRCGKNEKIYIITETPYKDTFVLE